MNRDRAEFVATQVFQFMRRQGYVKGESDRLAKALEFIFEDFPEVVESEGVQKDETRGYEV